MYEGGADIVFHAAGKSGLGVFQAAVAAGAGKWAIGVDSDQYGTATPAQQKVILTSMLKRVDTAVYTMIKASVDKTPLTGNKIFDLKSDGVGYATSNSIVEPFTAKTDEYKAKIISGEITVPTTP
jgi:basic membrane protein A